MRHHAIVGPVSEDDDRARQRLLALEREVRAEAEVKAARKAEALERVRARRAEQEAERQALRDRQAALVSRRAPVAAEREEDPEADADDRLAGVGRGLELARRADDVRQELSKPRAANEKSWAISAGASFLVGPIGWLYAGSWREAIPASAGYLLAAMILRLVPTFLLMPVMMVAMPLSGLAGLVYAMRYNRNGRRMRLFGPDAPARRLPPGKGGPGAGKALPPGKPRR